MNRYSAIPLIALVAMSVATVAEPQSNTQADPLIQGRSFKYQFRAGRYEVAPQAVAFLEAAVREHPDNIELLNELGTAYFMQTTAVMRAGAQPQSIVPLMQTAKATYERALQLKPADAYALAGRSMARIVLSNRPQGVDELRAALADLDRAVELEPTRVAVRLMRAFNSLALPRQLRNTATVEDDLRFLQNVASGTGAADTLAVLLGDVYLEVGRAAEARQQYESAAGSSSTGGELARARVEAIARDGVAVSEMAKLRGKLGGECTMCHGR
jgi:tetratricopeptide (TPR) repeat protein